MHLSTILEIMGIWVGISVLFIPVLRVFFSAAKEPRQNDKRPSVSSWKNYQDVSRAAR